MTAWLWSGCFHWINLLGEKTNTMNGGILSTRITYYFDGRLNSTNRRRPRCTVQYFSPILNTLSCLLLMDFSVINFRPLYSRQSSRSIMVTYGPSSIPSFKMFYSYFDQEPLTQQPVLVAINLLYSDPVWHHPQHFDIFDLLFATMGVMQGNLAWLLKRKFWKQSERSSK